MIQFSKQTVKFLSRRNRPLRLDRGSLLRAGEKVAESRMRSDALTSSNRAGRGVESDSIELNLAAGKMPGFDKQTVNFSPREVWAFEVSAVNSVSLVLFCGQQKLRRSSAVNLCVSCASLRPRKLRHSMFNVQCAHS